MESTLIVAAALMGLAGAPHCTAMCGAMCSATIRRCAPAAPLAGSAAFMLGRLAGYAVAGALAAWAVSSLGRMASATPALRALWTVFHLAALSLGLWLLVRARQPRWIEAIGAPGPRAPGTVMVVRGPLCAGAAGLAWLALPCGLLQSALVMAALADGPAGGAAAMAAFALTSSTGLSLVPVIVRRWAAGDAKATRLPGWAMRVAGLGLVATSGWALGHGLWERVAALCAT
ncbi:MAG TPA: sulfite exporter TauE/SafE family protein [Burkholderiaceae bacterium]|nr:sulfite exporter TauE/SafE family protein [Burkholderiaceae bacterium]